MDIYIQNVTHVILIFMYTQTLNEAKTELVTIQNQNGHFMCRQNNTYPFDKLLNVGFPPSIFSLADICLDQTGTSLHHRLAGGCHTPGFSVWWSITKCSRNVSLQTYWFIGLLPRSIWYIYLCKKLGDHYEINHTRRFMQNTVVFWCPSVPFYKRYN